MRIVAVRPIDRVSTALDAAGMGLKIKWNDDRVRAATTAVLLLARERIARGETSDVVAAALEEFRADPAGYKESKSTWAPLTEAGPLTKPAQLALYQKLRDAVERLGKKAAMAKIQFNSLRELDNWLIASLEERVRE